MARGDRRPPPAAKIRRWRAYRNAAGTMLGFLDVMLPSGHDHQRLQVNSRRERQTLDCVACTTQTGRDHSAKLNASEKPLWAQIVDFADRDAANRFRDLVLNALRRQPS
jgi:hypothetical protein